MSYIMMTVEEVKKYAKKDAIVLVATQDLTSQDCNVDFVKKKFGECGKSGNEGIFGGSGYGTETSW